MYFIGLFQSFKFHKPTEELVNTIGNRNFENLVHMFKVSPGQLGASQ